MKSVALFSFSLFSLFASTAWTAPAPAPVPAPVEEQEQRDFQRPVIQVDPVVTIPLRLLDQHGNYTQTLEPRASDPDNAQFTFPIGGRDGEEAPYMVCSKIPRARADCVVRVWFDSHGPDEEGRPVDGDGLYSEPSDIVFAPDDADDEESEPCVTLGVDSGDGKGEKGLMVRKIDVNCP
ncbi:hypothetical protein PG985_003250 [Apiospora marii]|uniref:Uncharacterized protein n=1 Tax=Apiospora marii TaxID=335849 RepID=A0ABR1RV20_9PEZI